MAWILAKAHQWRVRWCIGDEILSGLMRYLHRLARWWILEICTAKILVKNVNYSKWNLRNYEHDPHRRPMNGTTTGISATSKSFRVWTSKRQYSKKPARDCSQSMSLMIETNHFSATKKRTNSSHITILSIFYAPFWKKSYALFHHVFQTFFVGEQEAQPCARR